MPDNRVARASTPAHLQNFSIGYTPRGLVNDDICPRVTVGKQAGKYRVWGKDVFYLRDGTRAPGAAPTAMQIAYASDLFGCTDFALRHPLLDEERSNADADLRLEIRYTQATTLGVALMREKRVADLFTNVNNYASSHKKALASGSEWDTKLTTNPENVLNDLEEAVNTVADDASVPVSMLTILLPEQVFRKTVKHNTQYLDRIKYTQRGVMTADLVASVHGVKNVLLAAGQGIALPEKVVSDIAADLTPTAIWGDAVWVGVVGEPESEMEPAFARSFNWTAGTNGQVREVRQYRDPDEGTRKEWIEVSEWMDEKVVGKDGGYLITNTLG